MNSLFFRKFSSKIFPSAKEALKDIKSGSKLLVGGFGLSGNPFTLINELEKTDLKDLTVISNNCGITDYGLGVLLQKKMIKRMISSYVGENKEFERQYFSGELELELTPQGTLAEKLRSGGAGIPAFYTPTGVHTLIEEGGFPIKLDKDGKTPLIVSQPKKVKEFNGRKFVLEETITGDFALVKAYKADKKGNLIFRRTSRNFNDDCAMAAKVTIAEVEEIVDEFSDPDLIHLPGIYVDRIVLGDTKLKKFEKLTYYKDEDPNVKKSEDDLKREKIAKRAVKELKSGMTINLGIGIPTLVANYVFKNKDLDIQLHSENGMLGMGPFPRKGEEDIDLINAGKEMVTMTKGCSFFKSSDSFAMVRGRHMDMTLLGALQVSQYGDLANWIIPGKLVKGMGGAMDLVSGSRVVITMEHCAKGNQPKILEKCTLPLTGKGVVSRLITEYGVFDFSPEGMILREIFEGVTVEQIEKLTACKFKVAGDLQTIRQ